MSEATTTQEDVDGVEVPDDEYEHLRTKQSEREGNVETARVENVFVGSDTVTITFSFDWSTDSIPTNYDLDDDRDVLKLEELTSANGLDFEQVGHLEGMDVELRYTGQRWVPTAHLAQVEGEGSALETFRTELSLLVRSVARSPRFLRGAIERLRSFGSSDAIVAAVVFKKVLIAIGIFAIIAWLIL